MGLSPLHRVAWSAPEIAGLWVGVYWGSFTVGRILFGALVGWIRPSVMIRLGMAGMALGAVLLGWKTQGSVAFVGLALIGFALSPIFALMITSTQERLGPVHAPNAIGLQVAAAGLGVGILPGMMGVLAKKTWPGDRSLAAAGADGRLVRAVRSHPEPACGGAARGLSQTPPAD